jgi:hypothetical protein
VCSDTPNTRRVNSLFRSNQSSIELKTAYYIARYGDYLRRRIPPRRFGYIQVSHIEVDVRVMLWRLSPNALKLAAANADDRHPNVIVKLRITWHLQRAAWAPDR